jgi:hypothetical protein
MDYEAAEQDILEAGETLLKRHPDVGAIVTENHNMAPVRRGVESAPAYPDLHRLHVRDVVPAAGPAREFGFPALRVRDVAERWTLNLIRCVFSHDMGCSVSGCCDMNLINHVPMKDRSFE